MLTYTARYLHGRKAHVLKFKAKSFLLASAVALAKTPNRYRLTSLRQYVARKPKARTLKPITTDASLVSRQEIANYLNPNARLRILALRIVK